MTKLKQYYQFALVALGIAAFAPLAQAGTLSGSYVIYLKDGEAYSEETCEWAIAGLTGKGLSYADGVWTLNDFTFNTTNPKGIVCLDKEKPVVIKLVGANSIKTGDTDKSDAYGIRADGCASLTIKGSGSLTVTAGSYTGRDSNSTSAGIYADNLFVKEGATVTATGGSVGTDDASYGILAEKSFVVVDATVAATGKKSAGWSIGAICYGPIAVFGTGKVTGSSSGSNCEVYGVRSNIEPAAVAKDASDNVLTYDAENAVYFASGSTTNYAANVILTEGGVPNYTVYLKDGKAYVDEGFEMDITTFVAAKGLTYADSVWTMNGFAFTTHAAVGLKAAGDGTIKIQGENSITTDTESKSNRCLWLSGRSVLTGGGSLAMTTGKVAEGNETIGLLCETNLTVTGGAQLKVVSNGKEYGDAGLFVQGDLTVGDANVDVSSASGFGSIVFGVTSVSGTLKTKSGLAGFASLNETEPDAVARDADTGAPVYFGNIGGFYVYANEAKTVSCSNVLMGAEIQTEPMASSVTAPAHATAAVYTNGLLSADGIVWSNGTATVVYKADDGYCFADGSKAITNTLDTTVNPAVVKAGEVVPGAAGKPGLKLGVVAQRYPWNGTVDVQYKATHWQQGGACAIEVTVGEATFTNAIEIVGQGEVVGKASILMPAETKGKATFRVVVP